MRTDAVPIIVAAKMNATTLGRVTLSNVIFSFVF